jgi:hypothetical protein
VDDPLAVDPRITKAFEEHADLDPQLAETVLGSNNEYVGLVRASIDAEPKASEPIPEPQPLTKAESDALDSEIVFQTLFGDRAEEEQTLPGYQPPDPVAELYKSFGITPPSKPNTLEELVEEVAREAVAKVLRAAKDGHPRPIEVLETARRVTSRVRSVDNAFMRKLAEAAEAEDVDPLAAGFVKAFVAGDEKRMREVVAEVEAAA